jgi:hypothetical protein
VLEERPASPAKNLDFQQWYCCDCEQQLSGGENVWRQRANDQAHNASRQSQNDAIALTTSLYYSDPDRIMIELQVDNFGSWDASPERMRTADDFRRDPIGSFFDPDLVFAAYQAGSTFRTASKRNAQGKVSSSEAAGS